MVFTSRSKREPTNSILLMYRKFVSKKYNNLIIIAIYVSIIVIVHLIFLYNFSVVNSIIRFNSLHNALFLDTDNDTDKRKRSR